MRILLFGILFVIGCNKGYERGERNVYISKNLYSYLFGKNSWWVYKDNKTGTIDSVIVKDTMWGTITLGGAGMDFLNYRTYFTTYRSYLDQKEHTERIRDQVIELDNGSTDPSYWLFCNRNDTGTYWSGLRILMKKDTIHISGKVFHNITKLKWTKQYSHYPYEDQYVYYADSVGIIRKEILIADSVIDTWDIEKYKLSYIKIYETEKM